MPGYSGTPLAKKLGIKDNFRAALLHVPDDVKTELRDALGKCRIQHITNNIINEDLDFIFLFAKSRAGLELELSPAAEALAQSGLDAGLVDVKVCAVTDVWSGLKFVIPVKNRPKRERRIA